MPQACAEHLRLQRDPLLRAQLGNNAREVFDARFDKKKALNAWMNLIESVSK